jgi:hypothetical protein
VISGVRYLSPYYAATITFWNLALAFGMVLLIATISGYKGIAVRALIGSRGPRTVIWCREYPNRNPLRTVARRHESCS